MQLVEELTEKVDNNTIKNKDIRTAILRLTELSKVSIGASQKGINVYLKYYCLISKKSDTILTELDCPIDSFIENACKLKKISLKKLDFEDYKEMQIKLEKQYAMRIIADIEEWDKRKLEKLI